MDRKEAIEELKNITNVPSMFINETIEEIVATLEKPMTLADFLGWEEDVEYEAKLYDHRICRIKDGGLEHFVDGQWVNTILHLTPTTIESLRQAKRVRKFINLADFLGWEEDVEYRHCGDRFIIRGNELYIWNCLKKDWVDAYDVGINRFEKLRQAEKIENIPYKAEHSSIKLNNRIGNKEVFIEW